MIITCLIDRRLYNLGYTYPDDTMFEIYGEPVEFLPVPVDCPDFRGKRLDDVSEWLSDYASNAPKWHFAMMTEYPRSVWGIHTSTQDQHLIVVNAGQCKSRMADHFLPEDVKLADAILAHEVGHIIAGPVHSDDIDSVMYGYVAVRMFNDPRVPRDQNHLYFDLHTNDEFKINDSPVWKTHHGETHHYTFSCTSPMADIVVHYQPPTGWKEGLSLPEYVGTKGHWSSDRKKFSFWWTQRDSAPTGNYSYKPVYYDGTMGKPVVVTLFHQ